MAADLRLVPHAAQRHAHVVAAGGARHRLTQRRLPHARRAHEAQDRPLHLAHALLHREVLEDALLHFLQAEVVGIQDLLGSPDVALDFSAPVPRDRQKPVEVVAHHGRLRRHRAHGAQLLHLADRLVARFLGELRLVDALLELGQFVAALPAFAKLLLDRLQLFVEVVLALGLVYLALDA